MNVTIRGRAAVYVPDYTPTNPAWKIQLRDAHRLVAVGGTECFVKRFERRLPAWDFLVANRGQRHLGLPLIYDAQTTLEGGRPVYYLFLEKIEGELLHDLLRKGGKASGSSLGRAMAAAFRILHTQGYWHADFCTKNIMVTTADKQFLLIDLDSLEPIATQPCATPNQPGYLPDQELAVYALTYVKTYVQPAIKAFSAFPGPALNFVQLIFLLDKLVYFAVSLKPQGAKFGQKKHFEKLSSVVHDQLAPYTDKLVKDILAGRPVADEVLLSQGRNFQARLQAAPMPVLPLPSASKAPQQKKPVSKDPPPATVISPPTTKPPVTPLGPKKPAVPVIVAFTATSYSVGKGETTSLVWEVHGTGIVYISNVGTMAAKGKITLNTASFNGRTAFELTAGSPVVRKIIFIDFPKLVPQAAFSTSATPPAKTFVPAPQPKPVIPASDSGSNFWLAAVGAFLVLAFIISLVINKPASLASKFVPNQTKGLKLFDQGRYDSSFIHLTNFRHDTSYNFATQYNLAVMYDLGKGTEVNDTLAVNLYYQCLRSSAPGVVSNALYHLGMNYISGQGCNQDISTAKKYLAYAADNYNNQQARKELRKLIRVANRASNNMTGAVGTVENGRLGRGTETYKQAASPGTPAAQSKVDINTNQDSSVVTSAEQGAQTEKASPERILVYKDRINKHPTTNSPETSDIAGGGYIQSYCQLVLQPHEPYSDEIIKLISPGRYALIISRLPQESHSYYLVFVDGYYGYLASECIKGQ